MSIYNKDGNEIHSAFNKDGSAVNIGYSVDGQVVFAPIILKVMTYNVGGWYQGTGTNVPASEKSVYYALQHGIIEDNDPDILIIQEYLAQFSADGTSALTMLQSLFPYVHTKTSGTYFGRAICSKYPISNYTERQYTQEPSRYYDSCVITVNETPITVVTTHLGLTQADRTPEIAQLISFLESQSTFIAGGDYNTGITTGTDNTTSTAYINNVKPFLDAGFKTANFRANDFLVTCNDGVDGTGTDWYIDDIYTSSNFAIGSVYVDDTKLHDNISGKIDHMPLIATLYL